MFKKIVVAGAAGLGLVGAANAAGFATEAVTALTTEASSALTAAVPLGALIVGAFLSWRIIRKFVGA